MATRTLQLKLLKDAPKAYGGSLLTKRKGRSRGRPIDTRHSMHLVLRSSKAVDTLSFSRPHNKAKIAAIMQKFSAKYGVKIYSLANVGNHLHLQIKLSSRQGYFRFIRAVTAAIAMAVTGASRWNPQIKKSGDHFWDRRPFTCVVLGYRAFLNLRDYVQINQMEGFGVPRAQARFFLDWTRLGTWGNSS